MQGRSHARAAIQRGYDSPEPTTTRAPASTFKHAISTTTTAATRLPQQQQQQRPQTPRYLFTAAVTWLLHQGRSRVSYQHNQDKNHIRRRGQGPRTTADDLHTQHRRQRLCLTSPRPSLGADKTHTRWTRPSPRPYEILAQSGYEAEAFSRYANEIRARWTRPLLDACHSGLCYGYG
ncbi:hypothetical protein BDZ89DRAFT_157730 [Hymenopellis radicata]|nr:hypothetical protein BDZ89DRAFT_157730 [Hymenopellis radicata]